MATRVYGDGVNYTVASLDIGFQVRPRVRAIDANGTPSAWAWALNAIGPISDGTDTVGETVGETV